jgi:arginine decarboxylase
MTSPLSITVTEGTGTGPTTLAAFDAALRHAGIANFNLIVLSSVIPTGTPQVEFQRNVLPPKGEWGDRLYVVMAHERVQERNVEAWAGLGWVQQTETGKGLFVEHHGHSEQTVRADITASLESLTEGRDEHFGQVQTHLTGITCAEVPVCALVVAVFETQSWSER